MNSKSQLAKNVKTIGSLELEKILAQTAIQSYQKAKGDK